MSWTVGLKGKAKKQYRSLSENIRSIVTVLEKEIELLGPVRGNWPNYGKLSGGKHHCHLKKGKPTYVACWKVTGEKEVEVYYVGTHEKAPY